MSYASKKVLGIDITTMEIEQVLEQIKKYLIHNQGSRSKNQKNAKNPLIVFTPNPEIVVFASKNADYKRIVTGAQIKIPDGQGIVWAIKKRYGIKIKRLSGVNLMKNLCRMAAKKGIRIGLIGGKRGLALKVRECLLKQYQKLDVVSFPSPKVQILENLKQERNKTQDHKYENNDKKEILEMENLVLSPSEEQSSETNEYFNAFAKEIMKKNVDILFVAMGFPKQEYFIENIKNQILKIKLRRPLVMMGVGGAFDYIAGEVPRAPKWIRDMGFEWLVRLILEPRRLGRQLKGAEFFLKVLKG